MIENRTDVSISVDLCSSVVGSICRCNFQFLDKDFGGTLEVEDLMNKAVKTILSLLAIVLTMASAGCAHKPAYSDIDANKNSRSQNQNTEAQTGASQPAAEAPQAPAAQPGPAPEPAKLTMPAFMAPDGTIKDVPSYPRARRDNVQIGPIQETNVMTLALHTRDSMEKVQAFYTQAIKENQWTVTDKLLDPEVSEWSLKKDENNNAKVQAKKDPKTGGTDIFLVRAQKISAQPK